MRSIRKIFTKKSVRVIKWLAVLLVIGVGIWTLVITIQADAPGSSTSPGIPYGDDGLVVTPPPTFKLSKGLNFIAFDGQITPKNAKNSIFSAITPAKRYDPTLNNGQGDWVSLRNKDAVPKAGESFYLSSTVKKEGGSWTPKNVSAYTPTDETKPLNITLYPGWNMVANPYSHNYSIRGLNLDDKACSSLTAPDITCKALSQTFEYPDARKDGKVSSFYAWNSNTNKWEEHTELAGVDYSSCAQDIKCNYPLNNDNVLIPKTGYWIQNKTTGKLTLKFSALTTADTKPVITALQPSFSVEGTQEVTVSGKNFTPNSENKIYFVADDIIKFSTKGYKVDSGGTTIKFDYGVYATCALPEGCGSDTGLDIGTYGVFVTNTNGTSNHVDFAITKTPTLDVSVKTDKEVYNYGETVKITDSITNTSSADVTIGFSSGCISSRTIDRITQGPCTPAMTEFKLKPGESKTQDIDYKGEQIEITAPGGGGFQIETIPIPVGKHTITDTFGIYGIATTKFSVK